MTNLFHTGGAFALSLALSLLLIPLAIAVGKRFKLTVRPRLHGRGRGSVTYLGGAVVAVAAVVSVISIAGFSRDIGIVLVGASALLVLGLVDDRSAPHGISPMIRFLTQSVVAMLVWRYALRGDSDGLFEGFTAIFLLVGAANAVNLLDNMDGVAGATCAGTAIGIAGVALVTGNIGTAAVAAALAGACIGFLTANLVKPRVYLGDGGALFLGFLLAAAALKLRPAFGPGWGPVATVALLSVLATDSSLVILSRFINGKALFSGATDHISHRLVKLGISKQAAALTHGVGAIFAGGMCVFAWWYAGPRIMVVSIALFAAGAAALLTVRTYKEAPATSLRRRMAVAVAVSGLGVVLLAVPPSLAAAGLLREARADLIQGVALARELKTQEAQQAFAEAGQTASKAERELNSLLTIPLGVLPLFRDNLRAAKEIASGTTFIAPAAAEAVVALNVFPGPQIGISNGRIDLASWYEAQPHLQRATAQMQLALGRIRPDPGLLLPTVGRARDSFLLEGEEAVETLERATDAADLVPALFGGDGPRTWFLAIQNPVEMRATGGFLGAFGILRAQGGQVKLERLESDLALPPVSNPPAPPAQFARYLRFEGNSLWQNVNMTPDFPTAAALMTKMWAQQNGSKPDGVIAVDAVGLTYLLRLVGPVPVKGAGEITADNFLPLALNEAYIRFPEKTGRVDFLLEVGKEVWRRFLTGEFQNPLSMAGSMGEAIGGKHLQIWVGGKEASLERLGLSGAIIPTRGSDYLLVVGQNAAANKVDYYARRRISYEVKIAKDGRVSTKVDVRLKNGTPTGLPSSVVGPYLPSDPAGLNRSFLSVYMAPNTGVTGALVDGKPVGVESHAEQGLKVASRFLEVLPGDSSTLTLRLEGRLSAPGKYRLVLQHQPTLNLDEFHLEVTLPKGAFVTAASEGMKISGSHLQFDGPLKSDLEFFVNYGTGMGQKLRTIFGNP